VRIAQVSTCSGPVREERTGSVESMVWLLTRELCALGHEVTVFGCGGSELDGVACEFVETHPGPYASPGTIADWQMCDWMALCQAIDQSSRFDVVHSHAYLWGLPLDPLSQCPILHTMHTTPYEDQALLLSRFPRARFSALSKSQWHGVGPRPPDAVIHHGIDPGRFTFRDAPGDYVCYLGRFIRGKGPLEAIENAEKLGIPILLAGPENDYFREYVRPHVDGRRVRYLGEVDAKGRDALLGGARALLYPLREPEPFGLVQVEAMMCGTPVIAPNVGAVPEIIDEGVTGAIAINIEDLDTTAARAMRLDRRSIRARAEQRFSARRMAEQYAAMFDRLRVGNGK
jgi:glycosyltransferase involved in cell wall biosynthesis